MFLMEIGFLSFIGLLIAAIIFLPVSLAELLVNTGIMTERHIGPNSRLGKRMVKQALETFDDQPDPTKGRYHVVADLKMYADKKGWSVGKQNSLYLDMLGRVMNYRQQFHRANPNLWREYMFWFIREDVVAQRFGEGTQLPVYVRIYNLIRWSHENNGAFPKREMIYFDSLKQKL